MSLLLHLSDTHFGTELRGPAEALRELVREQQPALAVISGDLTQRARRAQFRAARAFLDALGVPAVLAIPGNHDIPLFNVLGRLLAPYRGYRRWVQADLEPEFEDDRWLVLCVNTTRRYRHKDGEVSRAQVEQVAARLRRARGGDQIRIVVTHQPVLAVRDEDRHNLLHERETAVRAWVAAGADLVLGGHIHLPYLRALDEAYAGLPRRAWAVQAGTAVSHRIRDGIPNSVNLIRALAGRQCEVERWDWDGACKRFAKVSLRRLRLDP
ncbi:MAG: metallophosphoesterase [Pseudomonadota bacterium]|uniref:Metallophosphoesterase n=2 Tax=Pseudomonadota TaxID=1224 RepID=A0ABY6MQL8_9BURK|nr:metallophosphoesterase [Schlegelella aquatica]UZD54110.1 metallophosphoesterase [Schlegelella aquatica]